MCVCWGGVRELTKLKDQNGKSCFNQALSLILHHSLLVLNNGISSDSSSNNRNHYNKIIHVSLIRPGGRVLCRRWPKGGNHYNSFERKQEIWSDQKSRRQNEHGVRWQRTARHNMLFRPILQREHKFNTCSVLVLGGNGRFLWLWKCCEHAISWSRRRFSWSRISWSRSTSFKLDLQV